MLVCGRPLTITGGHFWWCGQEADGVGEVRAAVRELLKDGADFLKIMCDGGGQGDTRVSFSAEELAVAVEEIHRVGKKAVAHCEATEAIARAAEAGIDEIEHINFLQPDGSRIWDQEIADKILDKGSFVCPTIQTGWWRIERLREKEQAGTLTAEERKLLDAGLYKTNTKLDFVRRFHEMGVPIVAGTDAITTFGDYAIGLELLHRAGLSTMDVIIAATSLAAEAIGWQDRVGAVKPGMLADMVYVDGDPLTDIKALDRVVSVVLGGEPVFDREME
jgi:imidazolonepropionase-like amidohydrolase